MSTGFTILEDDLDLGTPLFCPLKASEHRQGQTERESQRRLFTVC